MVRFGAKKVEFLHLFYFPPAQMCAFGPLRTHSGFPSCTPLRAALANPLTTPMQIPDKKEENSRRKVFHRFYPAFVQKLFSFPGLALLSDHHSISRFKFMVRFGEKGKARPCLFYYLKPNVLDRLSRNLKPRIPCLSPILSQKKIQNFFVISLKPSNLVAAIA